MFLYYSDTYRRDLQTAINSVKDIETLYGSSVMVTGATGLIGSFVVDMLSELNRSHKADIKIYALGRSEERLRKRFEGVDDSNLHFVEQDVNLPPQFDFSVDYTIHAASNAYPAAFANDPVGTVLSNILGTHYLLEYSKSHGVKRFLYVSSGEVYGQGNRDLVAFTENYSGYVDITKARSCYPSSKRAAETLCVSYTQQYGVDTVIVRPCHTYGPNATGTDNRANVQFVNSAVAGEDIVMKSSGTQMRSYCYISDCASALLTVLLRGVCGEAYNLANPESRVTIAEFAQIAARVCGVQVIFEAPDETAKGQQTPINYAVLDSAKLCSLGWTGKYSVEKGIANTIDILKDKRQL